MFEYRVDLTGEAWERESTTIDQLAVLRDELEGSNLMTLSYFECCDEALEEALDIVSLKQPPQQWCFSRKIPS